MSIKLLAEYYRKKGSLKWSFSHREGKKKETKPQNYISSHGRTWTQGKLQKNLKFNNDHTWSLWRLSANDMRSQGIHT